MAGDIFGVTHLTGLNVGGGTGSNYSSGVTMNGILGSFFTGSLTTVNPQDSSTLTFTATGMGVNDPIVVTPATSGLSSTLQVFGYISAAQVGTLTLVNSGATAQVQKATRYNWVGFKTT